jgi:hypothetical protein
VIGFSMTVHSYSEYSMLKAGAFEVLAKDGAVHELYSAIQRAVASIQPIVILNSPSPDGTSISPENTTQRADVAVEKSDSTSKNEEVL